MSTIRFLDQDITMGNIVTDCYTADNVIVYTETPTYFDAIGYMETHGGITHEDQVYRFYDRANFDDMPVFAFRRTFVDADHFIVEYRTALYDSISGSYSWGDESTRWYSCPYYADIHGNTYPGATYGAITDKDRWMTGLFPTKATVHSSYDGNAYAWEYPYAAVFGNYYGGGMYEQYPEAGPYKEKDTPPEVGRYTYDGMPYYSGANEFCTDSLAGPNWLLVWGNLAEELDDFEADSATPGGGGGTNYGFYSDRIGIPGLPSISIMDTGMASMWNPTTAQARQLSQFLWSDSFFDNILKLLADPLENVISFASVPLDVSSLRGTSTTLKVGNVSTGVTMFPLTDQYIPIDLGTQSIPMNWNTALDYEPGTQIELFLPFCGMFNLSASEVRGGQVHIVYNVDLLSGDFCAFVDIANSKHNNLHSVLYHKTGNLITNFPMTAANYSTFYKSLVSGAAGAISGAVTGNPIAAADSLVSAAMSIGSVELERTSSFSGACSGMSCRSAYLVLTQPKQHLDKHYKEYSGLPSYMTYKLGDCSGYTKVENVIDNTVSATDEEKAEIERLLKEGVYL